MINWIIGGALVLIFVLAGRKALSDIRKGKCAGCSCDSKKKAKKPVSIVALSQGASGEGDATPSEGSTSGSCCCSDGKRS